MFTIKIKSQFSGAHNLRGYEGKCEDLHGHNWHIELVAYSEVLDKLGMVMDFKQLKKILNEVLNDLDHKYLNDIEHFKQVNPTSENIAKFLYEEVSKKNKDIKIKEVTVWETDTSSATYSE